MSKVHIVNTNRKVAAQTLCGQLGHGEYDPTLSNCDDCVRKFKELYPKSWEAWEKSHQEKGQGDGI